MSRREAFEELTREQVLQRAERLARDILGVTAEEAYARLDRGELRGTIIEAELWSFRFLLGK